MHSQEYTPLFVETCPLCVGVVTDTHVPDRNKRLPRQLLSALQDIQPACILHAGDISLVEVLTGLESIAPVMAVRGNRDFMLERRLPLHRRMLIGGVKVVLTHGQGSLLRYLKDKYHYLKTGYDFKRYRRYFDLDFPDADLVVFGHTHTPVNRSIQKRHYFNTGAAYPCKSNHYQARIGRLLFTGVGQFVASTILF
ncbi:MAG: metallophosphoesterase family protein [Anaerolineaceae bacterium]|nr:metallophosphoesterase family protein [Anaerolineaceae bacterium]